MSPLAATPLHARHTALGARMVDFAGWSMPVQYRGIVEEHAAVRTAAGLFDVSHMGRLEFSGGGAAAFLDRVLTRRVRDLKAGRVRYALVPNEQGGIRDDVLVYRMAASSASLAPGGAAPSHFLVVNASNREKIVGWLAELAAAGGDDVRCLDVTLGTAMIAVQGPQALAISQPLVDAPLAPMPYYSVLPCRAGGAAGLVSRTGYTGEDGCELILPAAAAPGVWDALVAAAARIGGLPVGLGARDTLRLEAAMPLYGHELSETINPFQAGLKFAVDLEGREFVGRAALLGLSQRGDLPVRVGIVLDGKRAPREGYPLLTPAGEPVGTVTSGTFSPTLQRPVGMGYVAPQAAAAGTELLVDIRGKPEPARTAGMPFYRRGS